MLSYFWWRIFKKDVIGGISRRFRRFQGIYFDNSIHDNAEYHITRNGVDQYAIFELLEKRGYDCELLPYFSTQSRLFQPIGEALGIQNTFALVAKRRNIT
jgi:hypothetical protein